MSDTQDPRPFPPTTVEMIQHRFGYHRADQAAAIRHAEIRDAYMLLGSIVVTHTPAGREQALALTSLQESMMWSNAAIAMLSPVAPDPRETT
jgi:hypothetical protein